MTDPIAFSGGRPARDQLKLEALDLLLSFESCSRLRREQGLSPRRARETVAAAAASCWTRRRRPGAAPESPWAPCWRPPARKGRREHRRR